MLPIFGVSSPSSAACYTFNLSGSTGNANCDEFICRKLTVPLQKNPDAFKDPSLGYAIEKADRVVINEVDVVAIRYRTEKLLNLVKDLWKCKRTKVIRKT